MKNAKEKDALIIERFREIGMEKREAQHHKSLKRASVLIPLVFFKSSKHSFSDDGDSNHKRIPHVLLTRRSMKLRSHPGHAAYPGGKQDPEDKNDDVITALREAQEEVGLNPKSVEILCRQPTLESINHLCVTPIVGIVTDIDEKTMEDEFLSKLVINEDEVDEAFVIPLSYFLQPPDDQYDIEWRGETFVYRKYIYRYSRKSRKNDGIASKNVKSSTFEITGLTAHMSYEVAKIALQGIESRSASTSPATSTNTSNLSKGPFEQSHNTMEGYMWRLEELSPSSTRSAERKATTWRKGYFVIVNNATGAMLHQYDSIEQATKKANSANKKHRLPLHDCHVITIEASKNEKRRNDAATIASTVEDDKYEFEVSVLGGRIQWHLAASSDKERKKWIEHFQSITTAT